MLINVIYSQSDNLANGPFKVGELTSRYSSLSFFFGVTEGYHMLYVICNISSNTPVQHGIFQKVISFVILLHFKI